MKQSYCPYGLYIDEKIEIYYNKLDDRNEPILINSIEYTTSNKEGVILLNLNCIREGHRPNGGSTVNSQGWGRDKDEDDEQWWRRCLARSAAMMRPGGKKRQRGR